MHRFSLYPAYLPGTDALSRFNGSQLLWRTSAPTALAQLHARVSQSPWQRGLILAAIGAQGVNMLLAMYMTQYLGFGDVLLDVFGRWDMAFATKFVAFVAWWVFRESMPARVLAWILTPLSILALTHDVLLLF